MRWWVDTTSQRGTDPDLGAARVRNAPVAHGFRVYQVQRDLQAGAHERNRTADLLLTMQMLYRLSYVGLNTGTSRWAALIGGPAVLEYCNRTMKTWLSVLA